MIINTTFSHQGKNYQCHGRAATRLAGTFKRIQIDLAFERRGTVQYIVVHNPGVSLLNAALRALRDARYEYTYSEREAV